MSIPTCNVKQAESDEPSLFLHFSLWRLKECGGGLSLQKTPNNTWQAFTTDLWKMLMVRNHQAEHIRCRKTCEELLPEILLVWIQRQHERALALPLVPAGLFWQPQIYLTLKLKLYLCWNPVWVRKRETRVIPVGRSESNSEVSEIWEYHW